MTIIELVNGTRVLTTTYSLAEIKTYLFHRSGFFTVVEEVTGREVIIRTEYVVRATDVEYVPAGASDER